MLDTDRLPLSRALLAAARGRGGLVNEALEYALGGGEDYLLLFTARADRRSRNSIASLGRRHGVAISRVGSMDSSLKAGSVVDTRGQALEGGYQHFLTRRGARP
jgi:thiamine monophosphate kinase